MFLDGTQQRGAAWQILMQKTGRRNCNIRLQQCRKVAHDEKIEDTDSYIDFTNRT